MKLKRYRNCFPQILKKHLKNLFVTIKYKEKNFLEMKQTVKSEIDEENVNEYINEYLKSRNLRKENFKKEKM